jgi:virulence factor Mce-like protein
MRSGLRTISDAFNNPILTGAATIFVTLVAVWLSYTAQNGLPFVPTYEVRADLPNADELVKDADVRIGGARVGIVLAITPEPATRTRPEPVARITMQLSKGVQPLPVDSRVGVRLLSVLGGKYVEIQPGHSARGIPDGGTIPVSHANTLVDLDQVFRTFGPKTISGIRSTVQSLGGGLAGRGTAINDSLVNLHDALPALQRVLATIAAPQTDLRGFITGAADASSAFEPVAGALTRAFAAGATTFEAVARAAPSLGRLLDQLPGTESLATTTLRRSEPALADAQTLLERLQPAGPLLKPALDQLYGVATAATPVFHRLPALIGPLKTTLSTVDRLATDPASSEAFKLLGNNDLATFAASGFVGLGAILKAAGPAQMHCNLEVPWLLNFSSAISEGDAAGTWLRTGLVIDPNELLQAKTTSPTLHDNFSPHEDASECEGGNEPYGSGRALGNPPGAQNGVEQTAPPPGVTAKAAAAGLITPPPKPAKAVGG